MAKINYEESIKKLEKITADLEKGDLSLDEMVRLYSEGTKLAAECSKSLEEARSAVTKLTQERNESDE